MSRSLHLTQPPAPVPLVKGEDTAVPNVEEPANQKLPNVPQIFEHIDFKNYPYGHYKTYPGNRLKLRLKDGEHEYDYPDSDRGWFAFGEVYYTDLTGDRSPEAVVLLSHVQCGASCDGGSALIYIYAAHRGKLQRQWRYETGSLAYGCGLKSLSMEDRKIVVETFGRCPRSAKDYPGSGKFVIGDMTRSVFRFNGRRFTRRRLEFISTPERDVKNYTPEIRIG
jgi:hypothetical protein